MFNVESIATIFGATREGNPDLAVESGRTVEKPWGSELIWAETDRYVGKVISINPGKRLSLQYHEIKDEAILVTDGTLRLLVC